MWLFKLLSMITCAFEPPYPKELILARRNVPAGHDIVLFGTRSFRASKSTIATNYQAVLYDLNATNCCVLLTFGIGRFECWIARDKALFYGEYCL